MQTPAWFYTLVAAPYLTREREYKSTVSGRMIRIAAFLAPEHAGEYFDGYLSELPRILEFLESKLGEFPYSSLSVAEIKYFPGGRGTPGLILIGDPCAGAYLGTNWTGEPAAAPARVRAR